MDDEGTLEVETQQVGSPGWYLRHLLEQLHNRRVGRSGNHIWRRNAVQSSKIRPGLDLLDDYRRGDPPLRSDIHSGWAAPYRQFVRMGRLHFARKLVAPTGNRMGLRGFRTAASDDELGDVEARKIMRRNRLKLVARDVHDDMLTFGDAYVLVTPPDKGEGGRDYSLITAESPLHTITLHDPATDEAIAGLKAFHDPATDRDYAYLFLLPGEGQDKGTVHVAYREGASMFGRRGGFRFAAGWKWDTKKDDDFPGNKLPLIRFRNERGVGEFEEHLDHLDRINDKIFNEWWIEKIQAFRQRAIEHKDQPDEDDADYEPLEGDETDETAAEANAELTQAMSPKQVADLFVSSPDALWDLEPGASMWESTPVDVGPMITGIQKELQWLAGAADIPLSSLNPDATNQSAEGSSNQKEEHTYKVEDRRDRAEAGWATVMSLAFSFQDDEERADVTQLEVLWGPIERYSLEQRASAASQAGTTLPTEAIQRDIWQYDPAEIAELRKMSGADMLRAAPTSGTGQPSGTTAPPAPQAGT